jgi:CTP synthase
MKYIFVTGGSISGIGKGKLSCSIGLILQSHGFNVTFLKIDPYLNFNAGRLEPNEHGETFVLSDGTETDLDLGSYERYCNLILSKDNIITSGKLLYNIISEERAGRHNGKTLQFCTVFYESFKKHMMRLAKKPVTCVVDGCEVSKLPDFIIVEVGGTVSDMESMFFIKAISRFISKLDKEDRALITIDYAIEVKSSFKTRPLQNSLNHFKTFGLDNDILIYRSSKMMDDKSIQKISYNCGIQEENIIWSKHAECYYSIPSNYFESGLYNSLKNILHIDDRKLVYTVDSRFAFMVKKHSNSINVGLVSRYESEDDPYCSLEEALIASGKHHQVEINIVYVNYLKFKENYEESIEQLKCLDAIVLPGGFGSRGISAKIKIAEYARLNGIPFLGICLGYQISVIEFARNVLDIKKATSTEFDPTSKDAVISMVPNIVCKNTNEDIFLGDYSVEFKGVFAKDIYHTESTLQRFRHRYCVNINYKEDLEKNGLNFYGKSSDDRLVAFKLDNHKFFCGVQYHPELRSTPERVDPIFLSLIEAAIKK